MRIRSFSRPMRRPSGSPWPARLGWTLIAVGGIFFVALVARNLGRHDSLTEWRQRLEVAAGRPDWPEWAASWPDLPPAAMRRHAFPQELRGVYAFAARNRELLQHIPCYCGCVREGHRSNLNCFVSAFRPDGTPIWSDHSFSCPMCVHIAREAMLMSSQGMPVPRIREEIEKRYRVLGDPTNTPVPTHASAGHQE